MFACQTTVRVCIPQSLTGNGFISFCIYVFLLSQSKVFALCIFFENFVTSFEIALSKNRYIEMGDSLLKNSTLRF